MAVLSRLDVDMCNLHAAGTTAMMKAAVKMKSGLDKSTTNIAEMLIEGNNMGINDVVKMSHLYREEDTPFAGELIKLYDANVKELRRFL